MTQATQTETLAAISTIKDGTVLMTYSTACIGMHRKIEADEIATAKHGDRKAFAARKRLFESESYKAIKRTIFHARRDITKLMVASPLHVDGLYCLPLGLVSAALQVVEAGEAEFWQHVDAFVEEYPDLVRNAAERLGDAYNPADYPPVGEVRAHFEWRYTFSRYEVPDTLQSINAELFEDAKRRADEAWREARDEMVGMLRWETKELLDRAVRSLSLGEDGKPRRFHRSLFTRIDEFFQTFAPRNIAADRQLQEAVDEMRRIAQQTDVTDLRGDTGLRDHVREQFEAVRQAVDSMVESAPRRRFAVDD